MKKNALGKCYENAGLWMLDGEQPGDVLVHGFPVLRGPGGTEPTTGRTLGTGDRFGHAWIERGEVVYDVTGDKPITVPKEAYYAIGHIDPAMCHRYTTAEARQAMARHKHFGPWPS